MHLITLLLLFLLPFSVAASTCVVVGITDGDTLMLLCDKKQVKVRLAEIDAPERRQPFGNRSRQALSDLCFRKSATMDIQTIDRYGRTVARVKCNGIDTSEEQVKQGMAWVYDRYVKDRGLYKLQDQARAAKKGLWSDEARVPPWEWRRR